MADFNPIEIFSDQTQSVIAGVSDSIPKSIDDIIKVQEATDKSHKLHSLLYSWSTQQTQERRLRKLYAICFASFLGLQLIALNFAFFSIGSKTIVISEPQFNIFFGSMFGEITALVLIITRYLFPKHNETKVLEMLKDI